jgi:4-amino-4-deoxy-L-arabinose transferase-like glycosyltransferase
MISKNPNADVINKKQLFIGILLLAFILRLVWVLATPTQPISDFKEFDRLAVSLTDGKGYVNSSGQPTAYRPPGYIYFMAGIYTIFGHHVIAIRLVNVLLGVLTCWLTYSLAAELFNRRIGLMAAMIVAMYPSLIAWANILATENLFIPVLLGITLSFVKGVKQPAIRWLWLMLSGILSGVAVLIRPAGLMLPGVLLVSWVLIAGSNQSRKNRIQWLVKPGLIGLVLYGLVLIILLPWTLRNWQAFGRFVMVSDEGGITFLSGHNERALEAEYSLDGTVFDALNAEKLDEVSYDQRAYQLAFEFIRQHPAFEARLLVHKAFNFFKDDVSGLTYNDLSAIKPLPNWLIFLTKGVAQIFYLVVLGLAITSLFIKRHPPDRWYIVLLSLIIVWTAFHLAYYGKDRFRLPLTPALAIYAAVTLLTMWEKLSAKFNRKAVRPVKIEQRFS